MAIAEMKRISLLIMRRDHDRLLKRLQHLGCVQVTQVEQPEEMPPRREDTAIARIEADIARHHWAINKLLPYETAKKSMFVPLPSVSLDVLAEPQGTSSVQFINQAEEIERRLGDLRGHENRLRMSLEELTPWLDLGIPLEDSKDSKTTKIVTGTLAPEALDALMAAWRDKPVVIKSLLSNPEFKYFWAAVHRREADAFMEALRELDFQAVDLPAGKGLPSEMRESLLKEMRDLESAQAALQEDLKGLAVHLPELRLRYEQLKAEMDREQAQANMVHTASATLMQGWVPAAAITAVEAALKADFPEATMAFSEPEEGEEPPVLLQNKPLFSPFETVVTGFALPHPYSMDPTTLMMPFFACFFGMMVSDAGYGLLMAILIPIMIKIMKPSKGTKKLMWVLAMGGVLTVFWGAMYNTWFGFAPFPSLLDPMNNSLPVMAVCVGIGALHLFTGLGIGAYLNIRRGKFLDALYDQISWFLLVVGLVMLALPATASIGKWMAIVGALLILVMAGREKSKNPIKRLLSGLGALYNISGWMSDLLSYMRLFGMGLATGVIGMVINILVGMVMQSGIIGIVLGVGLFIGGHLFNAAINILGAYVHSCRLQYIEFFNKFYEEGGKDFMPLAFRPRFVRVEEA